MFLVVLVEDSTLLFVWFFPASVFGVGIFFWMRLFLIVAYLYLFISELLWLCRVAYLFISELLWLCRVAALKSLPVHPFNAHIFSNHQGLLAISLYFPISNYLTCSTYLTVSLFFPASVFGVGIFFWLHLFLTVAYSYLVY